MTRSMKSLFLITAAATVLSACSGSKGPGELGSKDDIVVRNKGIAAAQPPAGDFSTTVEQGEAVPAPVVAAAEPVAPPAGQEFAAAQQQPLPNTSPAMEQAVKQHAESQAPLPSAATPVDAPRTDAMANKPIDAVAPAQPVNAPAPAAPVTQSVQPAVPAQQYVATQQNMAPATPAPVAQPQIQPQAAAPVPVPAPVPAPTPAPAAATNVPYPLDANAPYSPKAIADAQAKAAVTASAPVAPTVPGAPPAAPSMDLSDPAMVRSVQAALASKAAYVGPQTGIIDADLLNALTKYQGANGLPMGGLNEPTLRHLGIIE